MPYHQTIQLKNKLISERTLSHCESAFNRLEVASHIPHTALAVVEMTKERGACPGRVELRGNQKACFYDTIQPLFVENL